MSISKKHSDSVLSRKNNEDKWFWAELLGSRKMQRCLVVSKSASWHRWNPWQQVKKSSCCGPV